MRLKAGDLEKVLGILAKIDQGLIEPRFPGRVGRFLREYRSSHATANGVMSEYGIQRRADGTVSGLSLESVELHAMLEPKVSLRAYPLGEVAETLAISEELGGATSVVMWLKGPIANAAYNMFHESSKVRLSGDFRWTPLARVTPGEGRIEPAAASVKWQDARCMKAVSDDLLRPPHAIQYVLDYRLGPPSIKYFRCVCARRTDNKWSVLPALAEAGLPLLADSTSEARKKLGGTELASMLIYRQPWSEDWTIVDAVAVDADAAFAHALTWADYQNELDGLVTEGSIARGIRERLRDCGLRPSGFPDANLQRKLLPVARQLLLSLR